MPVHLGSMGESIKTVMRENAGRMRAGDVYVLNDPYNGGTHLPDVTVISPVFDDGRRRTILFYVGSRGHHADIGGTTPGSMPPDSSHIEEEGVLIDNFKLVDGSDGVLREAEARALLTRRTLPGAQSGPEHGRPARPGGGQPEGRRGAAPDGRAFRPATSCAPTWATCRTMPRKRCGA